MKKQICTLNWNYWPGRQGGAETQARMLNKELCRQGESATVLTRWQGLGFKFREDDDGVLIYRRGCLGLFVQFARAVRRKFKKEPLSCVVIQQQEEAPAHSADGVKGTGIVQMMFDVLTWLHALSFMVEGLIFVWLRRHQFRCIHSHGSGSSGAMAAWIGRITGLPVLIREECLPVLIPVFPAEMPFSRYLDRRQRSCFFSAQNEAQREALIREGVCAEKIFVVLDGVRVPSEPAPVARNNDAVIVANVAQGKAHKAFDILFDAWRKVVDRRPDANLVLIGGKGDNSIWVKYAEQIGVRANVDFQGWIEDLDPFMKNAAMFILPSRREGVSIALLTSQSYGLPAVVSDIPGNLFVVENGSNGIVAPVENVDALAEGIIKLYENPSLREEMGAAARRMIEKRFSIHAVAERMIKEVYPAVAGASPVN